jgi:hypothetical protein
MPGRNRGARYEANEGSIVDTHRNCEIVPLPEGVRASDPGGAHREEDARDYAAELNGS